MTNLFRVMPRCRRWRSPRASAKGTYTLGETIRVTLTYSEAVDVTGAPRLKIKIDPDWGNLRRTTGAEPARTP